MSKMYDLVKEKYATLGLDTEKAMETLSSIPVSVHCWQGDDVGGFDPETGTLNNGVAQN